MDFIKKASESLGNKSSQQPTQQPAEGQPAQKDDYVDKAFNKFSQSAGIKTSHEQNEKITDAGRSFYEKQTGNKVDPKYSN